MSIIFSDILLYYILILYDIINILYYIIWHIFWYIYIYTYRERERYVYIYIHSWVCWSSLDVPMISCEVFNARSGDWMWGFRPCPLDSVPFRWRGKAFFIATWLDHSGVACCLAKKKGGTCSQMSTNVHNMYFRMSRKGFWLTHTRKGGCFRDVTEIVSWSDCICFFCFKFQQPILRQSYSIISSHLLLNQISPFTCWGPLCLSKMCSPCQTVWIFLVLSVSSIAPMLRLGMLSAEERWVCWIHTPHGFFTKILSKVALCCSLPDWPPRKHQPEDARVVVRLLR